MDSIKEMTGREYLSDTCVFNRDVYESTLPDGDKKPGILREIKGPVAEYGKKNRNGRVYSEKLWDKVLSNSYVQEQLKYNTLYGEANHPESRYEVDFGRVSHMIKEMWKVPASDQIFATIEILDTPLGRILNTLYEAGGILGYSSRAGGTLKQKKDYIEVDENTYNFITFDAVPFPSVQSARPDEIVESGIKELKVLSEDTHKELCRIISESSLTDKKAIKDFIYSLEGYDVSMEKKLFEETEVKKEVEEVKKPMKENVQNESLDKTTLSLLRESSLQINNLKAANQTLMATKESLERSNDYLSESLDKALVKASRIAVERDNLKEMINESNGKDNDTIINLQRRIKELEMDVAEKELDLEYLTSIKEASKALKYENDTLKLNESHHSDEEVKELEGQIKEAYAEISQMISESSNLTDSVNEMTDKYDSLLREYNKLVDESSNNKAHSEELEYLKEENTKLESEIDTLNESVDRAKRESQEYKKELLAVICDSYGLSVKDVKNYLNENFTKSDIYCACENMVRYSKGTPMIIGESKENRRNTVNRDESDTGKVKDLFGVNRRGV